MMPKWFVEERGFDGKYHPAIYHGDAPQETAAAGRSRSFRAPPVEIHPDHYKLTVMQAAQVYGADGAFRSQRP